jgi:uncharacterized protein YndB with AHSA1/START domain
VATDHELHVERDVDGAPEQVYDAFLAVYDDPLPDWVLASRRDLRVGGTWDITFEPPGVAAFTEHRVLTVVDRPHRLQYTARIAESFDTTVTFRTEQNGTVTRASLSQTGFPDPEVRDQFAAAWPDVLDLVVTRLAQRG